MFVATNIDDLVVLTVFFGPGARRPLSGCPSIGGQYLGFIAILVVSVLGALGHSFCRHRHRLLGCAILLGLRAAWAARRHRNDHDDDWNWAAKPVWEQPP